MKANIAKRKIKLHIGKTVSLTTSHRGYHEAYIISVGIKGKSISQIPL